MKKLRAALHEVDALLASPRENWSHKGWHDRLTARVGQVFGAESSRAKDFRAIEFEGSTALDSQKQGLLEARRQLILMAAEVEEVWEDPRIPTTSNAPFPLAQIAWILETFREFPVWATLGLLCLVGGGAATGAQVLRFLQRPAYPLHTYWTRAKTVDGIIVQVEKHSKSDHTACVSAESEDLKYVLVNYGCGDEPPSLRELKDRCESRTQMQQSACLIVAQLDPKYIRPQ